MNYCGIDIDYSRDNLFDSLGLKRLKESYMLDNETSPQERFAFVSSKFGSNKEHAQRLYEYSSKHWLSYSTPILSFGRNKNGLPISCFLPYLHDSSVGLVECLSEVNWLSMLGGGIGIGIGIRSADDKSTGVLPHLKTYDASSLAYRQGRCYSPGTEILTDKGWIQFENLSNDYLVGSVDDFGKLQFVKPKEIISEYYSGKMIKFSNENRGINISVTPNHSMVVERKTKDGWTGKLVKCRAELIKCHNEVRFKTSCNFNEQFDVEAISPEDRFLIACQADGHLNKKSSGVTFHFSKERKISRLTQILNECGYKYTVTSGKTTRIYVLAPVTGSKTLSWINFENLTPGKAAAYLEEISEWDSHKNREYSFIYVTVNKNNADIVQALAVIAGKSSRISRSVKGGNRLPQYQVFVSKNPNFTLDSLNIENYDYDGNVYCCLVDSGMIVVRNGGVPIICGNTRRGSYATYLDVSHPDILMFIELRKPTGDPNLRAPNLHHGINITDDFMRIIEKCMEDPNYDDSWHLKDPHSNEIKETVSAKDLWRRILETRMMTGEPYIHFIDTSNDKMPDFQKRLNLSIKQSNLCSEVILPTCKDRTAVCCLSSLNIEYYDEWKNDEKFIDDVAEMLDNVLTYFIENAPDTIHRAKFSAARERSIGVGALGFHSYLQKRMIPFEGLSAKIVNKEIFKHIRTKLNDANERLGNERGSCPDYNDGCENKYVNRRFAHVMAIAPNASSSIIMGNTSPSIEPMRANAYRQDTISGAFLNKNKFLDKIISEKFKDPQEIWSSIIANDGSVQHLDLDDKTKEVFKTAIEIDQKWLIEHAADRQEFIDQGQSLNLFFLPSVQIKYLHQCHFLAWKRGLKTLYYCRSEKIAKSDRISEQIERKLLGNTDCLMCEG